MVVAKNHRKTWPGLRPPRTVNITVKSVTNKMLSCYPITHAATVFGKDTATELQKALDKVEVRVPRAHQLICAPPMGRLHHGRPGQSAPGYPGG